MKHLYQKVVAACAVCVLSLFSLTATAEVKVIVNSSVRVTVTMQDIEDIFLGKQTTLPGGIKVAPVDQAEDIRNEFYKKIAKKDPAQLKAYWSRLIFTGKGMPPKELASDAEVIRYVANNPGAIGYVSGNAQLRGVNVVLTAP